MVEYSSGFPSVDLQWFALKSDAIAVWWALQHPEERSFSEEVNGWGHNIAPAPALFCRPDLRLGTPNPAWQALTPLLRPDWVSLSQTQHVVEKLKRTMAE